MNFSEFSENIRKLDKITGLISDIDSTRFDNIFSINSNKEDISDVSHRSSDVSQRSTDAYQRSSDAYQRSTDAYQRSTDAYQRSTDAYTESGYERDDDYGYGDTSIQSEIISQQITEPDRITTMVPKFTEVENRSENVERDERKTKRYVLKYD